MFRQVTFQPSLTPKSYVHAVNLSYRSIYGKPSGKPTCSKYPLEIHWDVRA